MYSVVQYSSQAPVDSLRTDQDFFFSWLMDLFLVILLYLGMYYL